MTTKILVLGLYFLALLAIGYFARTHWRSTPASYFLADRRLGALVLLATMAATNFSAFTVFGTSGAGYRDGWSFFPIMGFGTGFMALSFWLIGRRVWQVGRERGIITPPELVQSLYGSRPLGVLVALVMIVFTIPYLALQPMAAGYALQEVTGLPYRCGSLLITVIIVLYTLRGGMRAVAWTDLFQGLLLLALLTAALVMVAGHHGGLAAASQKVLALKPELFSRPGGLGHYSPGIWFSYMALWFVCDPMFPQLFQRFFAARSERAIARMMLLYPLVCTVVFLPPIAVGVLGHLWFPDLSGKQADRILPMVVNAVAGDVMAALVTAAGLAALMSTMDSQLLTLSSIFTRDLLPVVRRAEPATSIHGRIFVAGLSAAGLVLAWHPPATILEIATQTFTGLAVLFPTVLFGLYWRRVYPLPAVLSILVGEALLLLFHFKWFSAAPFLPVVWVMLAVFGVYLAGHGFTRLRQGTLPLRPPGWLRDPSFLMLVGVFLLAMDFWAWGRIDPLVAGLPVWIAHFIALSALQTAIMAFMVRRAERGGLQTG
ncbi:MAG: sodium:solute symporter family protein [Desulfobacterales bacterium]|jgi:SSS family solute:Na+ symporter|nr:sodium:solute symporter family protein [Desulfobacterales bacterium]